MSSARAKISSAESDDPVILVAVDRSTAELRRGGPVVLLRPDGAGMVIAAETAEEEGISRLRAMGEGDPQLVLTAERAAALGLGQQDADVVSLLLPARLPADVLWHLADPTATRLAAAPTGLARGDVPVDIAVAVVELTKLARLLPAAIVAPLRLQSATHAADWARSRDLLDVSVGAIDSYQLVAARSLRIVSEASHGGRRGRA
jgi:GTP cyclohydrolase II